MDMQETTEEKRSNITLVNEGDLFQSGLQTIVNPINCRGAMGKGLALAFKARYTEMYKDYMRRCKAKTVKMGEPYLWKENEAVWILNFPTKDDWRHRSEKRYIRDGLIYLAAHAKEWGITSLAIPALGCGLGELNWEEVYPLITEHLASLDIPITIYAPQNVPEQHINKKRLYSSHSNKPASPEFIFRYGAPKKTKQEDNPPVDPLSVNSNSSDYSKR